MGSISSSNSNANNPLDDAILDPFHRLRVSNQHPIFESVMKYDTQPLLWDGSNTGSSAIVTHLPNESSCQLSIGTASGEKVIRQTRQYFFYTPGRGQQILMTAVMGAAKANVRRRVGYFDAENGLFFENDGINTKVVRRTFVTGTAVDNPVNQSAWNLDKCDGTGPSGFNLDISKGNIFVIDFEWLGYGRARFGFKVGSKMVYCHEMPMANTLATVYMTTGKLPCSYTLENTGVSASASSMTQTCTSVMHEGSPISLGIPLSIDSGITTVGSTSNVRRPILSMRIGASFIRTTIAIDSMELASTTATPPMSLYELIWNGALTGATFNSSVGSIEKDVLATGITGGTVVHSGYVSAGFKTGSFMQGDLHESVLAMGADSAGVSDTFSVCVTPIGANALWLAQIGYREIV